MTSRSANVAAFSLVAATLLLGVPLGAQQNTIDFTVSGNSTVRGWTCTVKGTAQVTGGRVQRPAGSTTAFRARR